MIPTLFGFLGIGFGLIALLTTIFWIWMLIDCATNERLQGNDKIIWILVVIFLHWIGALIYFLVARKKTV